MDRDVIARAMLKKAQDDIAKKISADFLYMSSPCWALAALQSGSMASVSSTSRHAGVLEYVSHATNANSGVSIKISTNSILLSGGEKSTLVFKTAATQGSGTSGILRRFGFHDSVDHTAPVDGVYCKMADDTGKHYLTGHTANNSTTSTTSTKYELASNTWYRLVVELNNDATQVTFTLYSDTEEILWSDVLSSNIPTTRETGHADICTLTSSTGAITIGYIDYIDIFLPNTRTV